MCPAINEGGDLPTKVHYALVGLVPIARVDEVRREIARLGVEIVYQRLSVEPLRIVTRGERA